MYSQDPNIKVIKIISGDYYVTEQKNEMLTTVLGSCVTACIRDPLLKIGGMNHFLLPFSSAVDNEKSTYYGLFAMEKLINEILKRGGCKSRFEIKIFGGSDLNAKLGNVGKQNSIFIREFLNNDGYKIAVEDLGGISPRNVHYYPYTGKVMMRKVCDSQLIKISQAEQEYQNSISKKSRIANIEFF